VDIGSYVLIALLGAAAAYGLTSKGKPKPALSATRKNIAIICFGIAIGCFALVAILAMASHNPAPH